MVRPGRHSVADIGGEGELLVLAFALDRQQHGEKGRVLDRDAQLLRRRHQHETLVIFAQDGREQPHQFRARRSASP